MNTVLPPQIICHELPCFRTDEPDAVRLAFRGSPALALRQTWRHKEEASFAPANVRIGWRGESLLVFAELEDEDIFTGATGHNQRFWELGDTFEMFLRPVEQEAYFELHVSPNNQRLQLRFAGAAIAERLRKAGAVEEALVWGEIFHSKTWVQPEKRRWLVFAEVPAKSVCEKGPTLNGARWQFSFSRYDCARGRKKPVISSTSAHAKPDFHRQNEWGTMSFQP
jgi:hypothetical protein